MTLVCYATFIRPILILFVFLFGFAVLGFECMTSLLKGSRSATFSCLSIRGRPAHNFPLSWLRIVQSVSEYRMFYVFFNAFVDKFAGNTVSMGIGAVSIFVVSAGFGTIRLTNVVPMPHYLIFPLIMMNGIVSGFVWFPCALMGNDMFKEVNGNWCRQLHVFPVQRMKFVRRVVKGVKVGALRVMIGEYVFSEFDRGSQTGCFKRTLEYLITACLSISV
jgi:hypothetical protein